MVGKISMASVRERLHRGTSHNSSNDGYYSPPTEPPSSSHVPERAPQGVPFIASPLDPKITAWLHAKHQQSNLTLKRRPTVAQHEASKITGGIFRKQHEASPLELFFDLFFVANLAVFTYKHTQTTAQSVGSYIGFFCLMWTYWFHVSIHDVRFYVDSVLNRFFKMSQFAIFTSFASLGSIYSSLENGTVTRAFHGLALVFMVSRLMLMLQYGVVLWFLRPLKKTVLPCALMMLLYLGSGMAFLGSYLQDPQRTMATASGSRTVLWWYCIVAVEAILAILISSIWRILSFKQTHLVERAGLLTLIIMGEGVIGIVKSIAYVLDGQTESIWSATGGVIVGVFLIYIIFILYFRPIAHNRTGSIRQQFWALLHLPLHVAIVLTQEGSAATLLWGTVISARDDLISSLPSLTQPSAGFAKASDVLAKVNATMISTAASYTYIKLKDSYDYYPDLLRLKNISSPYASTEWNKQASDVLNDIVTQTSVYFFENFNFEKAKKTKYVTDPDERLDLYYNGMVVVFTFTFCSAGFLLLNLAAMYWLGKKNKTWNEYLAIMSRLAVGVALPCVTIVAYKGKWKAGFMFQYAGWIVPVILFSYLAVIVFDNIMQKIFDKRYRRKVARGEIDPDLEHLHKDHYNGAFGPQSSHEAHHAEAGDTAYHSPGHDKGIDLQTLVASTGGANKHLNNDFPSPTSPGNNNNPQHVRFGPDRDGYGQQPQYDAPPAQWKPASYVQVQTTEFRGHDDVSDISADTQNRHGYSDQRPGPQR